MDFWNEQYNLLDEFIREHFYLLIVNLFYTALIVVFTIMAIRFRVSIIQKIFSFSKGENHKADTLCSLLMSLSSYVIYAIAGLTLLSVYQVNIAPFLASAGIAGLALGFGAQKLVADIIAGFFIMFENQYHVGDFVEINGTASGTVEDLGLRMTTIREWSGKKFYIANSEINTVNNYNRGLLRVIISVSVPFEADLNKVFQVLEKVCNHITVKHYDKFVLKKGNTLLEGPQVYGITDINTDQRGATFTLTAIVQPAHYWFIEREFRKYILKYFSVENIEIAYPKITIRDMGSSTFAQAAAGEQGKA